MKIGIISDTHDHQEHVSAAVEIFNQHGVDYVLHAGDITTQFTVEMFAQLQTARLIAVFGNMDAQRYKIKKMISTVGGEIHDDYYDGVINDKRVYMTHTNFHLDNVIASNNYDLVIYGHTHHQDIRSLNSTLIINPGEATDRVTGSSHIVILELNNMDYQIISLP
jgi:putative phosphoesterase